jgi:hypothetical protein
LVDWGESLGGGREDEDIRSWLLEEEYHDRPRTGDGARRQEARTQTSKRMKQLELEFSRVLEPVTTNQNDEQVDNSETQEAREDTRVPVKVVSRPAKKESKRKRKSLAAIAAKNKKLTGWVVVKKTRLVERDQVEDMEVDSPALIDPETIIRREEAKKKKEKWKNRDCVRKLILEMVAQTEAQSAARNIMQEIVDRSWWRFKFMRVWGILEVDVPLQKVVTRMISKQEQEILEKRVSVRREERLRKKKIAEAKWSSRRALQEEGIRNMMDTNDEFEMEKLEESMRLWTLMTDIAIETGPVEPLELEGMEEDIDEGEEKSWQEDPVPNLAGNPELCSRWGNQVGCPDGWRGACTPPLPTGVKPQPHSGQDDMEMTGKLTLQHGAHGRRQVRDGAFGDSNVMDWMKGEHEEHDMLDLMRNRLGVDNEEMEKASMAVTASNSSDRFFGFGEEYEAHLELDKMAEEYGCKEDTSGARVECIGVVSTWDTSGCDDYMYYGVIEHGQAGVNSEDVQDDHTVDVQDDHSVDEDDKSTDMCGEEAYYGQGIWFMDRWILPDKTTEVCTGRQKQKQTNKQELTALKCSFGNYTILQAKLP